MKNIFFGSDHHIGHTKPWEEFKNNDGTPLRPFSSTEEMNEEIIDRHNAVVKPHDTVYFLGDVVINKKYLELVKKMNGKKRFVRGNHDIFDDKFYREVGFEKIYGVRVFVDNFILSHIPLHPDCITERFKVNVHGHLHGNRVMRAVKDETNIIGSLHDGSNVYGTKLEVDPRYFSVCMEQINYTPLHFDEVNALIEKQWEELNYSPPENAGWGNGSGPG